MIVTCHRCDLQDDFRRDQEAHLTARQVAFKNDWVVKDLVDHKGAFNQEVWTCPLCQWRVVYRCSGLVELQCPHGVGHPSEALTRLWAKHPIAWEPWMSVHGCDGDCSKPVFKEAESRALARAKQGQGIPTESR